jgi:hypothetical protein
MDNLLWDILYSNFFCNINATKEKGTFNSEANSCLVSQGIRNPNSMELSTTWETITMEPKGRLPSYIRNGAYD